MRTDEGHEKYKAEQLKNFARADAEYEQYKADKLQNFMRTDDEFKEFRAHQLPDSHLRNDDGPHNQRVKELGEEREKEVVSHLSSHS